MLSRRYLKGLECVPDRIKEGVPRNVKKSPWSNVPRPSQRGT